MKTLKTGIRDKKDKLKSTAIWYIGFYLLGASLDIASTAIGVSYFGYYIEQNLAAQGAMLMGVWPWMIITNASTMILPVATTYYWYRYEEKKNYPNSPGRLAKAMFLLSGFPSAYAGSIGFVAGMNNFLWLKSMGVI